MSVFQQRSSAALHPQPLVLSPRSLNGCVAHGRRSIAEQIPAEAPPPQLDPPVMEVENIVLAYIGLETALRDIAIKLGMGLKIANQRTVIESW
jgi:hypothetical protein